MRWVEQASNQQVLALYLPQPARQQGVEQAACYCLAVSSTLPAYRFAVVPELEQASCVADAVRRCWGLQAGQQVDVAAGLVALGWTVQLQNLEAPEGGLQAVMGPVVDGFVFIADSRPAASESTEASSTEALVNYRLAHELGHVFFYDHSLPPRRLARQSDEEEVFCDVFAAALVGKDVGDFGHTFV